MDSNEPRPVDAATPEPTGAPENSLEKAGQYVVVARRYRPQLFRDLIGQEQATTALSNAIRTDRVGHAYLFTGARGVGKTSAARIFAKALNCAKGPAPDPCNECEICQGVTSGEDVDVIEIDGASNRGIDDIRQLRSTANIRPSRCRYKIYIIDEVHMLSREAFNALLKTLEEPPGHVKFIFCTTDPEKMPITVLSRCQRFDFRGIQTGSITERLGQICEAESIAVEPEALVLLARQAAGSMRDSQSLLEQLFSFCGKSITATDVHNLLGTADGGSIMKIVRRLIDRDPAGALAEFDAALETGVDAGRLIQQLLGCYRDIAAASAGCGAELMQYTLADDFEAIQQAGNKYGTETALAALQLLDQAFVRMRYSTHGRILAETALVRVSHLENLTDLASLVARLERLGPGAIAPAAPRKNPAPGQAPPSAGSVPEKKNVAAELPPTAPETASETTPDTSDQLSVPNSPAPLEEADIHALWLQSLENVGDMTAEFAKKFDRIAISGPNRLVVTFFAKYTSSKDACERPQRHAELEKALSEVVGRTMRLEFAIDGDSAARKTTRVAKTPQQLRREKAENPFVQEAMEMFQAEITSVRPAPESDETQ